MNAIYIIKLINPKIIDTQKKIKVIGLYQIIGGVFGFIVIAIASFSTPKDKLVYLIFPSLILFGFSIFVGKQTFIQSKNSLNLTIANQLLQLVGIYIGKYGFEYISGFSMGLYINITENFLIGFNFQLSTLNYRFHLEPEKYLFSFNFVAITIIYAVEKIKIERKNKSK